MIEGIFGVGLSREVGGVYKEVIERINACGKPVIAIDIPSGISGDSGKILGCAVHASSTVTFGGYKRGHLLYPGREYCGDIKLVSIGFHNQTIKKYNSALYSAQHGDGDMAIIQLKKVVSLNPKFVRAHQLLALLYMMLSLIHI